MVQNDIWFDGIILNGWVVVYQVGEEIILEFEFYVECGSVFVVVIQDCGLGVGLVFSFKLEEEEVWEVESIL